MFSAKASINALRPKHKFADGKATLLTAVYRMAGRISAAVVLMVIISGHLYSQSISAQPTSNLFSYTGAGSTTTRPLASKVADTISARDYGAGNGGDDTDAIAAAFRAAGAAAGVGGGRVYFPPGTYNATQIKMTTAVLLMGAGDSTVLHQIGTTSPFILADYPANETLGSVGLRDLVVLGPGKTTSTVGLQIGQNDPAGGIGGMGLGLSTSESPLSGSVPYLETTPG